MEKNETSEVLEGPKPQSPAFIVIGMAGSGKTTFVNAFQEFYSQKKETAPILLNLDPAVLNVPYSPHFDIRNGTNSRDIMKTFKLGPNGAILTALNLYSAKFSSVLTEVEKVKTEQTPLIVDTPGQIEVFTWSASGNIISSAIGLTFPTVLLYIVDSLRCLNPNTFMSNMLFCLSIFFKTKLPLIVVLNKADLADTERILGWIRDYSLFSQDIKNYSSSYLASLSKSMALSLEEFYSTLRVVVVSSTKKTGFEAFLDSSQDAVKEYYEVFLPDLLKNARENEEDEEKVKKELEKLRIDTENQKPGHKST